MTTAPLAHIHESIDRLRRLRAFVRIGSAACLVVAAALVGLLVMFLLDGVLHVGRIERGWMLLLWVGGVGYVVYRRLIPAIRKQEDDSALALILERRQGIDTDLVAAVQFADRGRDQFGSAALREAVVGYVEEALPGLDLLEGFNTRALWPFLSVVAAVGLVWLLLLIWAPGHVAAFASRALLVNAFYPTRTQIVTVLKPGVVSRAGTEVKFLVQLAGELPEQSVAQVRSARTGLTSAIPLTPSEDNTSLYQGSLRVAHDSFTYRIVAGDAYTLPREVRIVPEPRLDLAVHVDPPGYASGVAQGSVSRSLRVAALEGSRIQTVLESDQALDEVAIEVDGKLLPMARDDTAYRLPTPVPPLSPLARTLTLRTHAADEYGIALDKTPSMTIIMQPDRKPQVKATAVTRQVLPTGTPTLRVEASDDFGLARIVLHQIIVPAQGEPIEFSSVLREIGGERRGFDEAITLGIQDMALAPGDRLELTVEAIDYRGDLPGASARSAPIAMEVTDRHTLFQSLLESDKALDLKLDQVIDAQLDIGDKPR